MGEGGNQEVMAREEHGGWAATHVQAPPLAHRTI